jgi:hypothetical protein
MKLSILSQILLIRFWANKGKFSPVFFSISVQYFSVKENKYGTPDHFSQKTSGRSLHHLFLQWATKWRSFSPRGGTSISFVKTAKRWNFHQEKAKLFSAIAHSGQLVKTCRHLSRQTICVSFRLLSGSSIRKRHQARTTILSPPPLEYSSCKSKAGPAAACV